MLDATHSYGRNLVGDTGDVSPHFCGRKCSANSKS